MERIAGRVKHARAGQRIVLFARSGTWWAQPFSNRPFTPIEKDLTWSNSTHIGTEYAALLVAPGYLPPKTTDVLPRTQEGVIAVATIRGRQLRETAMLAPKIIHFSGYQWEVLQSATDSGGVMHANSASNVSVDAGGRLHLRIARESGQWTCAEITLSRSLGYGAYSFVISKVPRLEPGAVLGMFVWDPSEGGQNHREIDIELSQWGDPGAKNGQFTIQPYYVPANVFRFIWPPARLSHSFDWEPGRASFETLQEVFGKGPRVVAKHVFTSGVPSPGTERVHINLYIFGKSRTPQQRGVEVVIEKFAYLP
jgi:hypothetical protein